MARIRGRFESVRLGLELQDRLITASREEHQQLLEAFLRAASAGDVAGLVDLLAADARAHHGRRSEGRAVGRFRNLRRPLEGAGNIAAFVAATSRGAALDVEQRELNGQPAVVFWRDDRPFAAILLAVADGKIQRVFVHADLNRLRYLGHGRQGH